MAGKSAPSGFDRFVVDPVSNPPPPEFDLPPPPPPFPAELGLGEGDGDGFCRDLGDVLKCDKISVRKHSNDIMFTYNVYRGTNFGTECHLADICT